MFKGLFHNQIVTISVAFLVLGEKFEYPSFPYPEIEDEYENDPDHPKWEQQYPMIYIHNIICDIIEENEEHLQRCPICRR